MSATKDREINIRRHTYTERESIAEGCASLLYLAAVLSPLSTCLSLLSFYVSLSVCRTIFFPGVPPLLPAPPCLSRAFTYVRPIQMAKVNFAITKYLARKSLRSALRSHPPFWRRHPPRWRNSPWIFTKRKGPPSTAPSLFLPGAA